jgi:hypothetical protein
MNHNKKIAMKRVLKALSAGLVFCLLTTSALADISMGVEVPLSYQFKDADDGSSLEADGLPSGLILLAGLPFFSGGVGLESYEIKLDQTGSHKIDLLMVDAYYVLPLPIANIALGIGIGTVEVGGDNASYYETTNCSQYFIRLGVPIGPLFEIIGSFHNVFAKVKAKDNDSLLEAGGLMTTIGAAFSF